MGAEGQLRGFFRPRRSGLEIQGARRPNIAIPGEWQVDYLIGRICTAGLATLRDVNDWRYTWDEIWQMHDMLDLQDWIDWQAHCEAERMRSGG